MGRPIHPAKAEAIKQGSKTYYTGEPCNLGLVAERLVVGNKCQCEQHKASRAKNANKRYIADRNNRLDKQKRYSLQNPDKVKICQRRHYERNKSKIVCSAAEWSRKNQRRRQEIAREWAKRNPETVHANVHKRRARKLNATPSWYGELDEFVLNECLELCKLREVSTGFKWEVDHIIPLAGKNVCGLHVWNNFQVIPMTVNRRKSNKLLLDN